MRCIVATTFMNGYSRAVPIVSSFFTVKDVQLNLREDYVEFLIAESEVKNKFPSLLSELEKVGMIATAKRSNFFWRIMPTLSSAIRLPIQDNIILSVYKLQKQKQKNRYHRSIPLLLFVATICIIFVDGILRSNLPLASTQLQN